MKKLLIFLSLIICLSFFVQSNAVSQGNGVLLEMCTGTWCGYCPCGHQIAEQLLAQYPDMLILEYHGPANGSDPFSFFHGNQIISMLEYSAYPRATIGRRIGNRTGLTGRDT